MHNKNLIYIICDLLRVNEMRGAGRIISNEINRNPDNQERIK